MAMPQKLYKNIVAHRLIVFPDDVRNFQSNSAISQCFFVNLFISKKKKVPADILRNLTDQIAPQRRRPKALEEHSSEEIENFPRLFKWLVFVIFKQNSVNP